MRNISLAPGILKASKWRGIASLSSIPHPDTASDRACGIKKSAQRFATERKAVTLGQLLAEMVIFEAGVGAARQLHDALARLPRQATVAGAPAVGVSQSRLPVFAHTPLQAFKLAYAQTQECGHSGTLHVSLDARTDRAHST